MALSDYALATESDLEVWYGQGLSTDLAETVLNRASAVVENYLDRHVITRGTLTEYHTFRVGYVDLYVRQWPIISVTSIHEDSTRGYGASYLLTADTDYVVVEAAGKITRIASSTGGESTWLVGYRAIKLIYSAGYANRDAVPDGIKHVALNLASSMAKEIVRGAHGQSSVSDDMGQYTPFGPPILTSGMKAELDYYKRKTFGGMTYELDN